jgi:inorganic pyrophosphatase/exopolyphosphatase
MAKKAFKLKSFTEITTSQIKVMTNWMVKKSNEKLKKDEEQQIIQDALNEVTEDLDA